MTAEVTAAKNGPDPQKVTAGLRSPPVTWLKIRANKGMQGDRGSPVTSGTGNPWQVTAPPPLYRRGEPVTADHKRRKHPTNTEWMEHTMGTNQNNFQGPVRVRFEDTRRAARLALAFAAADRAAVAAVLEETLLSAMGGDTEATTGLILAQAKLLGLNVGALDEHTSGAATAGLRHYIAESIRLEESTETK